MVLRSYHASRIYMTDTNAKNIHAQKSVTLAKKFTCDVMFIKNPGTPTIII